MEPVFVEVGISGLQTFNIREKGAAIQMVLFEHLFLCDHYQKCICSVVFIKKHYYVCFYGCFLKFDSVLGTFFPAFWLKSDFTREKLLKFLETRLCPKRLQWIPILVTSNNIFKNRLVDRRYPSVYFDNIKFATHV